MARYRHAQLPLDFTFGPNILTATQWTSSVLTQNRGRALLNALRGWGKGQENNKNKTYIELINKKNQGYK